MTKPKVFIKQEIKDTRICPFDVAGKRITHCPKGDKSSDCLDCEHAVRDVEHFIAMLKLGGAHAAALIAFLPDMPSNVSRFITGHSSSQESAAYYSQRSK